MGRTLLCRKTNKQTKIHYKCLFLLMGITQASRPERTALTLSLTENNKTFHGWFTKHTDQALAVKPLKGWADCKLPFVHLGSVTWCKTKQMHKMVKDIPLKENQVTQMHSKELQLYWAVSYSKCFTLSWEKTNDNKILFQMKGIILAIFSFLIMFCFSFRLLCFVSDLPLSFYFMKYGKRGMFQVYMQCFLVVDTHATT